MRACLTTLVLALTICAAPASASPVLTITPSACVPDSSTIPQAGYVHSGNVVKHAATATGQLQFRCQLRPGASNTEVYDEIQISFKDSSVGYNGYVRAAVYRVQGNGTAPEIVEDSAGNDLIVLAEVACPAYQDGTAHGCATLVPNPITFDFATYSYYVIFDVYRNSTSLTEELLFVRVRDKP